MTLGTDCNLSHTVPLDNLLTSTSDFLCNSSLVLAASYQGNLVAFMTNPGFQDAIDTPGKLIKTRIPIGMYNYQGSTSLAFQASTNPQYCEIWSAKDWITSFDDSYRKAIKGKETFSPVNSVAS